MSSANPSYKPSEGKREEFRKYLEKSGVMDALTRVLVNLYEEVDKPEDALEYIRDKLAVIAGLESNKQLQLKLAEAESKIRDLEAQLQADQKPDEGYPSIVPAGSISQQRTGSVPGEDTDQPVKSEQNDLAQEEPIPEDNPNVD